MFENQTINQDQIENHADLIEPRLNVVCKNGNSTAYESVLITLTFPLWTFITLSIILILIYVIRKLQSSIIYDKCNAKNSHFQYNFQIIVGKYTPNYTRLDSHLIIDLLDNQFIPTMTVQVPGTTVFNDSQILTFRHPRDNLRCVNFTIYRKNPMKEVRAIRVAHNCNQTESRLQVYGINLYDTKNAENKFFPILSVIKYRGTQWALNTNFESKNDTNFKKLGCEPHDPFGVSNWPTYAEIILMIFYIWCACLCFGHLIPVESIISSVTLHAFTILFISGTSAVVIGIVYLRLIKNHIIGNHHESTFWCVVQVFVFSLVTILSFAFWSLATSQLYACRTQSINWIISCVSSALILTTILLVIYFLFRLRRGKQDNTALDESDNILSQSLNKKKSSATKEKKPNNSKDKKDETLDNAFANSSGVYMKTKNRNSISQYV